MPISLAVAQQHVDTWGRKLAGFSGRKNWHKHLFHTCDLSVVRSIVERGSVVSRNIAQSETGIICDVANQGALWNNPAAHDYVRLYFRPKNGFHLKTEGIKSSDDPYRQDPHMSIPVTFAFDFVQVMCLPESGFLSGNFANTGAIPMSGDDDFERLDFDMIYHDSAPPRDRMNEYHNARMAEVVVSRELSLEYCRGLVVRNEYDRRSLDFALHGLADTPKVFLDQASAVFFKWGIYVSELTPSADGFIVSFAGPMKSPKQRYSVAIRHGLFERKYDLEASKRWRIETNQTSGTLLEICIEEAMAFRGYLPAHDEIVV